MNPTLKRLTDALEAKQTELQAIVSKEDISQEDTQKGLALKSEMETLKAQIKEIGDLSEFSAGTQAYLSQPATTSPHSDTQLLGMKAAGAFHLDSKEGAVDDGGLTNRQMQVIQEPNYKKAFLRYLRSKGDPDKIGKVELKYLSEGVDQDGGYLVPSDLVNRLVQKQPTPTNVAQYVSTFTTSRDSVMMPKVVYSTDDLYTTGMRVVWTGEVPASSTAHLQGTAAGTAQPVFGNLTINVYTAMMSLLLTNNLVEDDAFNLEAYVSNKFSETENLLVDNMIINGSGISQPAGILVNPGGTDQPATVAVGAAGALVADSVASAQWVIPEQYEGNLRWVVNKTSFGKSVRLLKDSTGRYLFGYGFDNTADLTQMQPRAALLDGLPVTWSGFCANIPNSGTAANVGVVGDLTGYYLVRRLGMSIQVLREINALTNQLTLLGRVRIGGIVGESWRMKAANVAAS